MIEIYSTSTKKEEKTRVKGKKKTNVAVRREETFSGSLESCLQFRIEGSLDELMDELKDQEQSFLEKQNLFELSKYKAIIRHILKMALDDGFRTTVLKRARADRSDYLIVQKINEKIDYIQSKITGAAAFNLLKEIEEIRGLLLDLTF